MNIVLISLLLIAAAATVVLLVALWFRTSGNRAFAQEVREDLRVGREEQRSSNREANDTVVVGIRAITEMGGTIDTRVKALQEGNEAKLEATRASRTVVTIGRKKLAICCLTSSRPAIRRSCAPRWR